MRSRTGERVGWIGGWMGGFIWLAILSALWLVKGEYASAAVACCLLMVAVSTILFLAPWRYPATAYRTLMLPIYLVLFAAIGYAAFVIGLKEMGLSWWSITWLFPVFMPMFTLGTRCWNTGRP